MNSIQFEQVREEICHLLRNSDIFTIAVRGVTTKTDNFVATAGQTQFTLSQTAVKNIRSLTVQSVSKYFLRDYTVNFSTGIVTLNTGATLSDAVAIQYDYGTGDKIYPDMPRVDLTLKSFPRIGIELTSMTTAPLGLGGMSHLSDILVTIIVWVPANKDTTVSGGLGGTADLNNTLSSIRDAIRAYAKSFYSFKYITPVGLSPIIPGTNNVIIQLSQDYQIKFLVEAT